MGLADGDKVLLPLTKTGLAETKMESVTRMLFSSRKFSGEGGPEYALKNASKFPDAIKEENRGDLQSFVGSDVRYNRVN